MTPLWDYGYYQNFRSSHLSYSVSLEYFVLEMARVACG